MLNQLIKLFLERPEKLERILLLLLKSLVIIWLLNTMIISVSPDSLKEFSNPKNFIDFQFLSKFSPYKSALYIVCFTLCWLILWELMSLLVVPIAATISKYTISVITIPFILILLAALLLRYKTLKNIAHKTEIGEIIQSKIYGKSILAYIDSFLVFHVMNIASKSHLGSKLLLLIIEHERSYFIKSRVMTYYGILLLLTSGVFFQIESEFSWLHLIGLTFVCFLGSIVATVRDVFKRLSRRMIIDLRVELPMEIYRGSMDLVIKEHSNFENFVIQKLRTKLVLKLNSLDQEELCDYPRKEILIYRPYSKGMIELGQELKTIMYDRGKNKMLIIVCNCLPDIPLKNFLEKNKIHFLYAQNEDELHIRLNMMRPIIKKWKNTIVPKAYYAQFDDLP